MNGRLSSRWRDTLSVIQVYGNNVQSKINKINDWPIGPIINDWPIGPIINDWAIGPIINDWPIGPIINDWPIGPIINDWPIGPIINDWPISPIINRHLTYTLAIGCVGIANGVGLWREEQSLYGYTLPPPIGLWCRSNQRLLSNVNENSVQFGRQSHYYTPPTVGLLSAVVAPPGELGRIFVHFARRFENVIIRKYTCLMSLQIIRVPGIN